MARQTFLFQIPNDEFLGIPPPVMLIFTSDNSFLFPQLSWLEDRTELAPMEVRRRLKVTEFLPQLTDMFRQRKMTYRKFSLSRRTLAALVAGGATAAEVEQYTEDAKQRTFDQQLQRLQPQEGPTLAVLPSHTTKLSLEGPSDNTVDPLSHRWFFPMRGTTITNLCSWMRRRSVEQNAPISREEWRTIVSSIFRQVRYWRQKFPKTYPSDSDINMDKINVGVLTAPETAASEQMVDLLLKLPKALIKMDVSIQIRRDTLQQSLQTQTAPNKTDLVQTTSSTASTILANRDALKSASTTTTTGTTGTVSSARMRASMTALLKEMMSGTGDTATASAAAAAATSDLLQQQQQQLTPDITQFGQYSPTIAVVFTQPERALMTPLLRGCFRVAFDKHSGDFGIQIYHFADLMYWMFKIYDEEILKTDVAVEDHEEMRIRLATWAVDNAFMQENHLEFAVQGMTSRDLGKFLWKIRDAHDRSSGNVDMFAAHLENTIMELFGSK
jgi:hypothetical protein